jgi:hypothetical protein
VSGSALSSVWVREEVFMGIGRGVGIVSVGALALLAGAHGAAQAPVPLRLAGVINDYSAGGGGPWHVHADWQLHVKGASGQADFSAAVAMVRSDLWVVLTAADPANTEGRSPHTHHVAVADGDVTALANGIRITGTATVTGNGNPSFVSPVTIDITGGSIVPLSNASITFGGAAAGHFGTAPLNGVVTRQ